VNSIEITGAYEESVFSFKDTILLVDLNSGFNLLELTMKGMTKQGNYATAPLSFTVCGGEKLSLDENAESSHVFTLASGI
jgi:hypothetical protein